jgi:hypothetical protein
MPINVVGLDIAKHVFQVHAADVSGRPLAQVQCHDRSGPGIDKARRALGAAQARPVDEASIRELHQGQRS